MTYFLKSGNTFYPKDEANLDVRNLLPVGTYTIKQDKFDNFFFEEIDPFSIEYKVYGDTLKNADRIIQTFQDRPKSTGVMLTGEKGSGKTLLAKMLSIKCAELGIPTIIINQPWVGEEFNTLIQSIEQQCMILFDEFEKTYDRDDQTHILTLLDGVFPSRKLFVLTCNDKYRVDSHMRNRPGRIYYMIDFGGLTQEFVEEFCQERLYDKSQIKSVCKLSSMFSAFNFDMLQAICEEMNRYGESAEKAVALLNTKPQTDDGGEYLVTLNLNGEIFSGDAVYPSILEQNPLTMPEIQITFYGAEQAGNDDVVRCPSDSAGIGGVGSKRSRPKVGSLLTLRNTRYHRFTFEQLVEVNADTNTVSYVNEHGSKVIFAKKIQPNFHYTF